MAVRMALTKSSTLQKLLVFTLLTLTGLGFPPPLAEADVKCYKCTGCSGEEGQEESCPSGVCQMVRTGPIIKACGQSELLDFIKCAQQELKQTGSCVKFTSQKEIDKIQEKCKAAGGESSQRALEGRQDGGGLVEMCACDTDLCNINSLLPEVTEPPGPTGPGQSMIECYCKNQHLTSPAGLPTTCEGDGPTQCIPGWKACNLIKAEGGAIQGCDPDGSFGQGKDVFECVQKKMPGGSGNCVKGTKKELFETMVHCGGRPIGGGGGEKLVVEICTCNTNLCNSDGDNTGGTGGEDKSTPKEKTGATGAGEVVISSTKFEITGVLVSLFATICTNGLQ